MCHGPSRESTYLCVLCSLVLGDTLSSGRVETLVRLRIEYHRQHWECSTFGQERVCPGGRVSSLQRETRMRQREAPRAGTAGGQAPRTHEWPASWGMCRRAPQLQRIRGLRKSEDKDAARGGQSRRLGGGDCWRGMNG